MKSKLFKILLLFITTTTPLFGQREADFDLQSFIESLFNTPEESMNHEDIYERLLLLYENPINLNTASNEALQSLFILSPAQISSLQEYILRNGKLLTNFELQYIEGFDLSTINKLLPFITIDARNAIEDTRPLLKRILTERNNYFIFRHERAIESKRGYQFSENEMDSRYVGSPDKFYWRYRVSKLQDFSLGLTAEKDAGEALTWDRDSRRFGADFWSAHFMLERKGKWRKIILGDYQLQFGQGLLFGSGLSVGKGSETVNSLQKANLGIRPYTSVVEGGFLRGGAATYNLNSGFSGTAFISRLRQDANIRNGENEDFETYFSSIQLSGLHRIPNEIANKHQVTETVYGFNLDYKPNDFKRAGIIATTNTFSTPIQKNDQAYNQFEFSGTLNYNISLYGNFRWQQFYFFGEGAMSKSGGKGSILGFRASLSNRVDFAMILRDFQRDFHSMRGAAFGENSRNINERGMYWGIKYQLNNQLHLSAYYDSFRFPWLRFRVNTPSAGNDYLIRMNYVPKRGISTYFQFRRKNKEANVNSEETNQILVLPGQKNQYLINVEFKVSDELFFRSRVQFSNYKIDSKYTQGSAFIQDAVFKSKNITFSGRMALFDTEGAQNRQYAYERDVLYAFSIPAYSGRGIRNYFLINYKLSRHIDIWARIARTTFHDRNEIGTGLELINGNKRTDVKFQVRYKIR